MGQGQADWWAELVDAPTSSDAWLSSTWISSIWVARLSSSTLCDFDDDPVGEWMKCQKALSEE